MSSQLTYPSPQTITASPHIPRLLQTQHAQSLAEEAELKETWTALRSSTPTTTEAHQTRLNTLMRDKMIALEADKAAFIYTLLRGLGATRVVEVGTSCGVSTVYLALAVGQNAKAKGLGPGVEGVGVVGTEWEAGKVERARALWKEAGTDEVEKWIELREGDLRETLIGGGEKSYAVLKDGSVDVVLLDIWTPLVVPALEILEPKLKPGAILLADNTISSAVGYADFFAKVRAPGAPYRSVTLPFAGGMEMVVYCPGE